MSDDIKPGEKVLVEGAALIVRGTHVRVEFLNADGFAVDLYLKPADVHRASDFLRPKFRVGETVRTSMGDGTVTESFASYVVDILGDGGHVFSETELQPAPVKTPLDEAREWLEKVVVTERSTRSPHARALLDYIAELERWGVW